MPISSLLPATKPIGKALLLVSALLYLLWHFAPRELLEKQYSLDFQPGPNREIFRVLNGAERFPKFTSAIIEPQDAKPGEVRKLTVAVEDPAGITEVGAVVKFDNGIIDLPLKLVYGDKTSGYWTNAWVARATYSRNYRVTFVAQNALQKTNSLVLAQNDPCNLTAAEDWIIDSDCAVSGTVIATNNIFFAGPYTMVINGGATLTLTPETAIDLSSGSIALSDNARVIQTGPYETFP